MTTPPGECHRSTRAEEFGELCRGPGTPPDVFEFLESRPGIDLPTLIDVLLVDQAWRIERGRLRLVEDYWANCPEVARDESLAWKLVRGEYLGRVRQGEPLDVETFLARFPRLKHRLPELRNHATAGPADHAASETTIDVSMGALWSKASPQETVEISIADLLPLGDAEDSVASAGDESSAIDENATNDQPVSTVEWDASDAMPDPGDTSGGSETLQSVSTLEWDASAHGMQDAGEVVHETPDLSGSSETVLIDPQSLEAMLEEFGTAPPAPDQTAPRHRQRAAGVLSDTLFDEGAAYDRNFPQRRFGEYVLLGEIARGGMGVVFKAKQVNLKRIVALKMILAGQLAGPEDIRRFYAEAESAACLDHPNIVPVYEVGECRGQHFFSMGYVEGKSLAEKVADHPLPAREAAELLKTIAEAVAYAHQRGVIHRDLKPANVLLDGQGHPKITDFGLAKRTEAAADLTSTGQIMGTPSYMPPEQATGENSSVGPHSDTYSLGAVLYCLLTGRPPFQAPSVWELLQQVKEQEPVSPKRLAPNVPVDLETVCLKCLAKEPERRYESAQALADDLQRFLQGVPVLARPVGGFERTWRWCKRYPVVAGLIAAVICSLTLGAGVSTYYAIAADRRAREAVEQFERAERNFQKAQAAVDQFFVQVSENTLLNQPGMQPLQHELLKQALAYYQAFLEERGDDPELRDELAVTQFRVGLITEAVESPRAALGAFELARTLQEDLLEETPDDPERLRALGNTLTALGRVIYRTQGPKQADETYQQAVALRRRLASLTPEDREAKRELANAYMNAGLVEMGLSQSEREPALTQQTLKRALASFDQAQDLRGQLIDQDQLTDEVRRKVRRDLGMGAYNLGNLYHQLGQPQAGDGSYEEAAGHFEEVLTLEPDDQRNTLRLAICYRRLAAGKQLAEQAEAAWTFCQRAFSHLDPLVRGNPKIVDYVQELAELRLAMGGVARMGNRAEEAAAAFLHARELISRLLERRPDEPRLLLKALLIQRNLAELARAGPLAGKSPPAPEAIKALQSQLKKTFRLPETPAVLKWEWAIESLQLGGQLHLLGQTALALPLHEEAVATLRELADGTKDHLEYRHDYHVALRQLADTFAAAGQSLKAKGTYTDLKTGLMEMARRFPDQPEFLFQRVQARNALARLALTGKDWDLAVTELHEAERELNTLIERFPEHQPIFEQERQETERLLGWLRALPAIAEKP